MKAPACAVRAPCVPSNETARAIPWARPPFRAPGRHETLTRYRGEPSSFVSLTDDVSSAAADGDSAEDDAEAS